MINIDLHCFCIYVQSKIEKNPVHNRSLRSIPFQSNLLPILTLQILLSGFYLIKIKIVKISLFNGTFINVKGFQVDRSYKLE